MPTSHEPPLTGKIIKWDHAKGYGFLHAGRNRVFLHRRDFAERHKRPDVGDAIRFTLGRDAHGRTCALDAVHVNDGGRITFLTLLSLTCLLVLPALAWYRRGSEFLWVGPYALVIGLLGYGIYALDKRRAREHGRRIPENLLHLTELCGGWPGAFLAQRRLRHKVSKVGFQVQFWLIVLIYQFAAYDSLQHWQLSRAAWDYMNSQGPRQFAPAKHPLQ